MFLMKPGVQRQKGLKSHGKKVPNTVLHNSFKSQGVVGKRHEVLRCSFEDHRIQSKQGSEKYADRMLEYQGNKNSSLER